LQNFATEKDLPRIKGFAFFTPFHLEYLFEMKFVILMLGNNHQFLYYSYTYGHMYMCIQLCCIGS
jgi:hypothetical protein